MPKAKLVSTHGLDFEAAMKHFINSPPMPKPAKRPKKPAKLPKHAQN
jgi:hypothetical protein